MLFIRRAIAHLALSRSDAALIKASGGTQREVRGKLLDPRFQFIENRVRESGFDWSAATPDDVRARSAERSAIFGGARPGSVRIQRVFITGRSHSQPARLYLPFRRDNKAAMLVYFHAGGGVAGSLASCDRLCGLIARAAAAPVLSVDYRLAPEHRFPVGYQDALAAYQWARENAARFGAAVGKAAVGGDSIGGQFAAAIALEQRPQRTPALQLLIYPMLDYLSNAESMRDFADAFPLTMEAYDFYKRHYLPDGADPSEPRLSPGRAQNLSGLPRTLLYTAGFDILLDQGEAYAGRLVAAGVPLAHHCFETLPHGFVGYPTASPTAEAALQRIARETGEALKRV